MSSAEPIIIDDEGDELEDDQMDDEKSMDEQDSRIVKPRGSRGGGKVCAIVFTSWDKNIIATRGPNIAYLIFQWEAGGKQHHQHYQGYAAGKGRLSFNEFRRELGLTDGSNAWMASAKGSPSDNKSYCSKARGRLEGPWEFGEIPDELGKQGERSDLQELYEEIKRGRTTRELVDKFPAACIRYYGGIQKVKALMSVGRRDCSLFVLWGTTGTGKTTAALTKYPGAFIKNGGNKWWDGYDGEDVIIVDDYRSNDGFGLAQWLTLVNGWSPLMETKGGSVKIVATKFIVTSNTDWREWWNYNSSAPFGRRITKEIVFTIENNKVITKEIVVNVPAEIEYAEVDI